MKRPLTSLILFVVVLAIPNAAFSQEFRNMELNPFFAGTAHTKSLYENGFPQTVPPVAGEFRYRDSFRGGLRFNVNTTGHWGEELFFSYEPNKAQIIRKSVPQQEVDLGTRILNTGLNVMYYTNEDEHARTRPFFTVGLGATMDMPTAQAVQIANDPLQGNLQGFKSSGSLALNYGVGFKQQLAPAVAFRMDVRGFISRTPTFGLLRSSSDPAAVVFPATGATQTLEISAGLVFRLNR
jgi:Outer membrane protein beta-barrel domain